MGFYFQFFAGCSALAFLACFSISSLDFLSPHLLSNFLFYLVLSLRCCWQNKRADVRRRKGRVGGSGHTSAKFIPMADSLIWVRGGLSPLGAPTSPSCPRGVGYQLLELLSLWQCSGERWGGKGGESSGRRENEMGDFPVFGINGLHWQMSSQVQTGILSLS